ncbi:hypothetical protein FQN54_008824 [Arachnomyces sp. PD_36]|nr:hypothetical protein FQN54_008824 [Arachnomyces sp. PD_36]
MDVLGLNLSNPNQQHATYPYATSVASSASSSSSSVFSLDAVSSQSSISSTSTGPVDVIWENGSGSECQQGGRGAQHSSDLTSLARQNASACNKVTDTVVPPELRQNPRRTNQNGCSAGSKPPSLVRQCERKNSFVDSLVDSATQIVEIIWPLSVVAMGGDSTSGGKGVLPLRTFIQETLRRSRTSYSTLQVALYYLIMIKPHVPKRDFTMEQPRDRHYSRAMQCGRRMFLSALILASKYLQDRNYSARAWSKISGLDTQEINENELTFLKAVGWRLHISESIFQKWTEIVLKYTPSVNTSGLPSPPADVNQVSWQSIIPQLTPELDIADPETPSRRSAFARDSTTSPSPSPWATPSRAKVSPIDVTSTPSYSRSLPAALEPSARMDYTNQSLPSLPKLNLLPTPQMTPQTSAANTPAASTSGSCMRRRSSISAAMLHAQNMCAARTTSDARPMPVVCKPGSLDGYPVLGRRSSLARSTSSTSSPESMISDVSTVSSSSSRSSRSSSISSVASGTSAPSQPRLAVRATRRCANLHSQARKECRKDLVIATPIDEAAYAEAYPSPNVYDGTSGNASDLSHFTIDPTVDMKSAQEAAQGLCELAGMLPRAQPQPETPAPKRNRKRVRPTSGDSNLQNDVRHLISLSVRSNEEDSTDVLPDTRVADSFMVPRPTPKAAQSPFTTELGGAHKRPLPLSLPKSTGSMKRACCEGNAMQLQRMVGMVGPDGADLD